MAASDELIVYVIGASDGPQKIGIANRLKNRLAGLQSANGFTLEVAGSFVLSAYEAREVERYAHYLLAAHRLRGEWFDVSPAMAVQAVEQAISDVQQGKRVPPRHPPKPRRQPSLPASALSATLREARIAAGISQGTVAKAVGISQAFLSDIERGRRELGEQHYEKLPEPIRVAVVRSAIADLQERIGKLRQFLKLQDR